jgi:hypothetical protein
VIRERSEENDGSNLITIGKINVDPFALSGAPPAGEARLGRTRPVQTGAKVEHPPVQGSRIDAPGRLCADEPDPGAVGPIRAIPSAAGRMACP